MNKGVKKTILFFLSIIMFIKRFFALLFQYIGQGFAATNALYERTIGPTLYQWTYTIQKRMQWIRLLKTSGWLGFFGRRSVLQGVLFLVLVVLMVPQTRLYTAETPQLAGRNTLLYKLVGPGDQEYTGSDSYIVEEMAYIDVPTDRSWREGSVSAGTAAPVGSVVSDPEDISAISMGGGAVTKPTILPGNELPTTSGGSSTTSQATGRKEIIEYTVQDGDTIGAIADAFNISLETILWANNLTARSYIRPGDTLEILPTTGVMHTVKKGDTVSSLARTYDAEADKIIAFNNLSEGGTDIIIGETLVIPDGEKQAPAATYTAVTERPYTPLTNVAAPPPSVAAPAGSGYLWPTSVTTITQYFGLRHTGVDIAGPIGSPLYASKSGTVLISQCGWNGGYGCYIIIDHGGGINTLYGHASQLYVEAGDQVTQGQTIAAMGSTGNSTGPHVHFEVRVNGARTNPLQYIR